MTNVMKGDYMDDEYKFPELTEKDFAPHAGDEEWIGDVDGVPVFVLVEDDSELQIPVR